MARPVGTSRTTSLGDLLLAMPLVVGPHDYSNDQHDVTTGRAII